MQSRYAGTSDLTGLFMVNMTYKKAQTELCRSTKTLDEVYKIALSYERGDKNAKSYKISGEDWIRRQGNFQIKAEAISSLRGGFQRPFQRGTRGSFRGNAKDGVERRCFNWDEANFTADLISKCPAGNATCIYCKKEEFYEQTCRGKRGANRRRVGLIHGDTG